MDITKLVFVADYKKGTLHLFKAKCKDEEIDLMGLSRNSLRRQIQRY